MEGEHAAREDVGAETETAGHKMGKWEEVKESQDQEGGERSSCQQQRQETTAALARTLTHTHTHAHTQLLEIQPCMPVD